MEKKPTSFNVSDRVKKLMDRVITNPPPELRDPVHGVPRNRSELLERLVEHAVELQKQQAK